MDWTLPPDDRDLLEAARAAAERAAAVHRERAHEAATLRWEEKGTADFVTDTDREAESVIVETLLGRFPDHAIVAEEAATAPIAPAGDPVAGSGRPVAGSGRPAVAAALPAEAPIRWVIDPLDGTTNWLHGYPEYAASIAAIDAEGLRIGVVLNSATGETFTAVRGHGSRRDGEPIEVSAVAELRLALVGTGFPFKSLRSLPRYLDTFDRVLRSTSGVRRSGSAALDLCDVACGRFDAFWELALMPWDFAAGILIIREAGGRVERLRVQLDGPGPDGGEAAIDPGAGCGEPLWPGGVLAANPRLFEPFRALVLEAD